MVATNRSLRPAGDIVESVLEYRNEIFSALRYAPPAGSLTREIFESALFRLNKILYGTENTKMDKERIAELEARVKTLEEEKERDEGLLEYFKVYVNSD